MSVRRPAVRRVPGPLPVFFPSEQPCAACHAPHTRARRVGRAATAAGGVAAAPAADPAVGVDNRARDAHPHAAAGGGRGGGRRGGGRDGRGGRGGRIPRGGGQWARRRWRRGSHHRPSRGGRRDGWARGAARPLDGLVSPQPPRPAATAATAVAAASTGVPVRAVAEATAAVSPRRRGVGGGARLPCRMPAGGRCHGRPRWGAVGPPTAALPLTSPPPPDGVAPGRGWGTPDPAPRCRWSLPQPACASRRRCACARVGAACGGRPTAVAAAASAPPRLT